MHFKENPESESKISELSQNISRKLSDVDFEVATEYLSWLDKKTSYFKSTVEKSKYKTQPDDLQRGDIVWAEFGINVGTELSDFKTKGHYALVWAVDLGNLVVIPLSSRDAYGSALTYDLGVIEGLGEFAEHSYLKLDAIRSISKRRIARMVGKAGGKITLSSMMIKKVKKAMKEAFLN